MATSLRLTMAARSISLLLSHGWRHAVAILAILAVLVMAMRIHPHAATADGHADGRMVVLAVPFVDLPEDPQAPSSPDEACDCPSVPALAAETLALPPVSAAVAGLRLRHPDDRPDSCSYPPDPPPARLG